MVEREIANLEVPGSTPGASLTFCFTFICRFFFIVLVDDKPIGFQIFRKLVAFFFNQGFRSFTIIKFMSSLRTIN